LNTSEILLDITFSHMGLFVRDVEQMAAFYANVLGFTITDRGKMGEAYLVFLSRNPEEHHQLVLVSGRTKDQTYSVVNQISFKVSNLKTLRQVLAQALADGGASDVQPATHGNAISVYLRDPEGNRIEIYMDTPWYCAQPLRQPINLDLPDEEVMAQTEALARSRPKFQPRAQWVAEMKALMRQSVPATGI
jgi:catechol-2,3-dioxygenase